jgi:hypothetical protein
MAAARRPSATTPMQPSATTWLSAPTHERLAMHRGWRLRPLSATAQMPQAAAPRRSGHSRMPRVPPPPLSVMPRRPAPVQQTAWRSAPMHLPLVTAALPLALEPTPQAPIPWPLAGQRIRSLTDLPRLAPTPLAGRRRLRTIRSPLAGSPLSLRLQPPALPSDVDQPSMARPALPSATAPMQRMQTASQSARAA